MQEWYLGWEKVSCLERCPQFRSVLREREVPLYYCVYTCGSSSDDVMLSVEVLVHWRVL